MVAKTMPNVVAPARADGEAGSLAVRVDGDRVMLPRAQAGAAIAARRKLEKLGLTESDVADAVAWARKKS